MIAIMMVPIVGGFALATESSTWFMVQRSMQHAADSAALAAATSDLSTGNADYNEAASVASNYGYVNGSGNVTVLTERAVACPSPLTAYSDCYRVTVTKNLQLTMSRLLGYSGDVVLGSGRGKTVQSIAMARPVGSVDQLCFIGLSTTGNSLTANGGGNAVNWNGCSVYGNSNLNCNGNGDRGMSSGYAAGTSTCGTTQKSNQPVLADPYSYLSADIPSQSCPNYTAKTLGALGSGTTYQCGPTTLTQDITVTNANTILVVDSGSLALGGHKLSTSGSGSLTIMFTGPSGGTAGTITGSGTVDYAAPNTGALSGIAWIQNPILAGGTMNFAGNSPTIDITGLVYMPKTDATISGTIHFHTGGNACFGLVANTFRLNGNIKIIDGANTQCGAAGVALPTIPGTTARAYLVQ